MPETILIVDDTPANLGVLVETLGAAGYHLMVAEDGSHMAAIERFIGRKIERVKLENFNYKYTALFDEATDKRSAYERKVKGVRLSGGYYFGPTRRRRR